MLSARLPTGGIRREAWILLSGNFLGNIGLGLFFPILPLFVTGRGGSPALQSQITDVLLSRDAWLRHLLQSIEKKQVPAAQLG